MTNRLHIPFRTFAFVAIALAVSMAHAQLGYRVPRTPDEPTPEPAIYGPYNIDVLAGGVGLIKPLVDDDSVAGVLSAWTLYGWVKSEMPQSATQLLAGVGESTDLDSRYIGTLDGKLMLRLGAQNMLVSTAELTPGSWHLVVASCDGHVASLFLDGHRVAQGALLIGSVRPLLEFAPAFPNRVSPTIQLGSARAKSFGSSQEAMAESALPANPLGTSAQHFGGRLAGWTLTRAALSESEIAKLYSTLPNFDAISYEDASKSWPLQTYQQAGYRAPQDPSTLPHSNTPFSKPVASSPSVSTHALERASDNSWLLRGSWMLASESQIDETPAKLSQPGYHGAGWMAATVPGTVLTTMVDRGIYPDPYYGLNNMAIPETLNKQSYWYRTEFILPREAEGHSLTLTFDGINYAADIWLNGQRVGNIRGAFVRGTFDVTKAAERDGVNVLAVRISPPPHPGIPNEQSIRGGPGENGGSMLLDGPTFVATEGWDWVPAIRDRDTGIWQDVRLTATKSIMIGDPQVVTKLPLPRTDSATIEIDVPLQNKSESPVSGTVRAEFEGVSISKQVTLGRGDTNVKLTVEEFAQLRISNPRLWWPNGYGKPELYHLKLTFSEDHGVSDERQLGFGIRELTYELSLFDKTGALRRVAVTPAEAGGENKRLVDITHAGIREIPTGWAYSLAPGADQDAAVQDIPNNDGLTQLVIRVNGVRIAARGGNWGMDDARKRVSPERLEPYFRLHRDAGLNIIRNWVGQSTEEAFYDLADKYGLMVWNDFWESTQDYNAEAQNPDLFLKNAADVIQRYRNHPSILLWCGRNEGVPQPIINEGLDKLVQNLDGTRYYTPSSNSIELQVSGPYHYQDPVRYYTVLNRGFSVETGTPSMPTLEAFRSVVPAADQWPINDTWAYHDWHASGNGDSAPFMKNMEQMFGAPTDLEDFERKAQLMNYVSHRAIFEGFNAHLWAPNSGRMLWMTQPAWPSTTWQIISSDYDTQASFYGVKKACEPLHAQLDLSTYHVQVVNTTNAPTQGLKLTAALYDSSSKMLISRSADVDAGDNSVMDVLDLQPAKWLDQGVVFVKLELRDNSGAPLSDNFYWLSGQKSSPRELTTMRSTKLTLSATRPLHSAGEQSMEVSVSNPGKSIAIAAKLTLILPAYYSDNYVSLLPGEKKQIKISYPDNAVKGAVTLGIRGWNISAAEIGVQ
jgi:hypothetical protein